jgi:hypothetical protein
LLGTKDVTEQPEYGNLLYSTPEGIPVYGRAPTTPPEGGALQRGAKGFWEYTVGALAAIGKGLGSLALQGGQALGFPTTDSGVPHIDPNSEGGQMLRGLVLSHLDQAVKANQALHEGRDALAHGHLLAAWLNYLEYQGHALGVTPLVGPIGPQIAEILAGSTLPQYDKYGNVVVQGQSPDVARGIGQGLGTVATFGAPHVVPPLLELRPFASKLPAIQQEALGYLQREGVPLRAGQLTGSRFLQANEATAAHEPFSSQAAEAHAVQQAEALQRVAGRLGEQAYPTPVSPYEAGQEAASALQSQISDLNEQENTAYERAWRDADNPQFSKEVPIRTDFRQDPTGRTELVPTMGKVAMPVDVRWMKLIANQELPKLEYLPAAEQAQSAAVSIFKKILAGNDYISAPQAEEALKGLKGEARGAASPELRTYSQGMAAGMIPKLQAGIDSALAEADPAATEALQSGRRLHFQKMQIADIADKLRQEPVQAFNQMTMRQDAGVDLLKKVADRAPDIMPRLGRAWLDNVIDRASREGDWRSAQTILNNWFNLGDQTKRLMFPDATLRQNLDRFFLGQKVANVPINPSGTALVRAAQEATTNPIKLLHGLVGSWLFFSPRGIRLLTKAIEHPPMTAAGRAALQDAIRNIKPKGGAPPEGPRP